MKPTVKSGLFTALVTALISIPFVGWKGALLLGLAGAAFLQISERTPTSRSQGSASLLERFRPLRNASILTNRIDPRLGSGLTFLMFTILPFLLNRYQTDVVTLSLLYVILAIGLNYIVGLCGLLALGYSAFYAIGAYTCALLNTHLGWNIFLCMPIGFVTGGLAGVLIGLPVLRLRGDYLAIVTLGFGEIVRIVLNNWDSVTAGPNGIMGIARPAMFGMKLGNSVGYFYITLSIAAFAMFVQSRLISSRIGRAWEAVREDELAAAHVGVPVVRIKLLAMGLGGAWAGLAGVIFASRLTHVSPESFTFMESVLVLCMVVLGGMGSVWGVAVGALALILAPEFLRGIELYRMLVFGLMMILMMRFRREGFIPSRRLKIGRLT